MTMQFDNTARVWEVFTDEGEWMGAYDTRREAWDAMAKMEMEG